MAIWFILIVSGIVAYSYYAAKRLHILFGLRQFLLGAPICVALINKIVDKDAIFTLHMQESQGIDIIIVSCVCTLLALLGSHTGYVLANSRKTALHARINQPRKNSSVRSTMGNAVFRSKTVYIILILLIICLGYIVSLTVAPVWEESYASSESGGAIALPVQTHFVISITLLNLALLCVLHLNVQNNWHIIITFIITWAYVVLGVWMVRGYRMEVFHAVFSCAFTYLLYKRKVLAVNIKYVIFAGVIFIFGQVLANLRTTLSSGFEWNDVVNSLSFTNNSNVVFNQGTLNDLAANLTGVIYYLKTEVLDYQFGYTYWEYILRTPPEFLYNARPEGSEWIFVKLGASNGGGFSEIAEAYYNFSFLGCLIIPMIISYILMNLVRIAENNPTFWGFVSMLLVTANFFRGSLYSTFAFYKAGLTILIISGITIVSYKIFVRKKHETV